MASVLFLLKHQTCQRKQKEITDPSKEKSLEMLLQCIKYSIFNQVAASMTQSCREKRQQHSYLNEDHLVLVLNTSYLGAHLHVHTTNQELKSWCYTPHKEPFNHGVNYWLFWVEDFCSVFTRHAGLDVKFSCWRKCNWNQCASRKGIHFNKPVSSSKKQFAEKFLISSPDKLVDSISGSISQQWLKLSSLNCSGVPLCCIPHTHTHWNHRSVNAVLLRCSFLSWPEGLNLNYPLKLLNFAVNLTCASGN